MSYEHCKIEFSRNFDDPYAKDSAIRKIEVAVQKTNQKIAEFVAYIRKLHLEADLPADQLWAFLCSAVPTFVREHLTRTRNHAKRTGPPMVEEYFQDILLARKQVEESAEDKRRAQQTQKEKQRMVGNQDSVTGAGKAKGSTKQSTNKSGIQKRKRGNRKAKNTESGSNADVFKKSSWKSKKLKFSQEEQEQHKAKNLCFSCGKGGH